MNLSNKVDHRHEQTHVVSFVLELNRTELKELLLAEEVVIETVTYDVPEEKILELLSDKKYNGSGRIYFDVQK